MPDRSAPRGRNRKLTAARNLADWLSRSPRGFEGLRERIYGFCDLRDPDTIEDVW